MHGGADNTFPIRYLNPDVIVAAGRLTWAGVTEVWHMELV
jgi:hypothetical protein